MKNFFFVLLLSFACTSAMSQNQTNDSYMFFFVNINKSANCQVSIDSTRTSVKLTLPKDCVVGDDSIGLEALRMFVVNVKDGKYIVVPVIMEGAYDFSSTTSANLTAYVKKILGPNVVVKKPAEFGSKEMFAALTS
jgi:hypothetical protein